MIGTNRNNIINNSGHNNEYNPFSLPLQTLINWFVFFLAFPSIYLLGNSITFFLFLLIIYRVGNCWPANFSGKSLIYIFLGLVLMATIFAPYSSMERHPGFGSSFLILIQYIYWAFAASFFIAFRNRLDYLSISKWFFYGTLSAIIGFYLLPFQLNLSVVNIIFIATRNSFVFGLLVTIPISYYYLIQLKKRKILILSFPFFLFAMLFTNGRSGAVIIIFELMFIASIIYPYFQRMIRIMLILLFPLFYWAQTDNAKPYLYFIADKVEGINPRFSQLIRGEGEGDLTFDKSWLIRKLMIDKSIEIFNSHPLLGVGPNNFIYYDSSLSSRNEYARLASNSDHFYNTRSAHNSYIQILSEIGIIGFVVLILLLFIPIITFLKDFYYNNIGVSHLPLVSLFGMALHFYAISSITGAVSWVVIGFAWSATSHLKMARK